MLIFLIAFLVAAASCLLIIRYSHLSGLVLNDYNVGPQKVHMGRVPRVGGLGVFLGLLVAGVVLFIRGRPPEPAVLVLSVAAALPAFVSGFVEDLIKCVPPWIRLSGALGAGALGAWVLGAVIHRTGIPSVDRLLSFGPFALVFTMFAVAGIAHATNIVDGFNGLSAGVSLICLLALAYVAFKVGDLAVFHVCVGMAGALLGFLIWNYPAGLIFLGDGGAYFVGTVIAECAVLLVARNPRVSPWFPMLVLIYPIMETLFTIYRRIFVRGQMPDKPDALHLHSLIYRRLLGWMLASPGEARRLVKHNAMTAPYLWGLTILCAIPAILLYGDTLWLVLVTLTFVSFYVWLYACIVKFRTPVWLRRMFRLSQYHVP